MKKIEIKYYPTDQEIKEAISLDNANYKIEDAGDYDRCIPWYRKNKEIYTFLKLDGKVIGYINFVPLTDRCYAVYKSGKMKDYQITADDILKFKPNQQYHCLLMSIVLKKEHRNTEFIKILWNAFKQRVLEWKKKNIIIDSILADCVSNDGINFISQYLHFSFICSRKGGKIYEGHL